MAKIFIPEMNHTLEVDGDIDDNQARQIGDNFMQQFGFSPQQAQQPMSSQQMAMQGASTIGNALVAFGQDRAMGKQYSPVPPRGLTFEQGRQYSQDMYAQRAQKEYAMERERARVAEELQAEKDRAQQLKLEQMRMKNTFAITKMQQEFSADESEKGRKFDAEESRLDREHSLRTIERQAESAIDVDRKTGKVGINQATIDQMNAETKLLARELEERVAKNGRKVISSAFVPAGNATVGVALVEDPDGTFRYIESGRLVENNSAFLLHAGDVLTYGGKDYSVVEPNSADNQFVKLKGPDGKVFVADVEALGNAGATFMTGDSGETFTTEEVNDEIEMFKSLHMNENWDMKSAQEKIDTITMYASTIAQRSIGLADEFAKKVSAEILSSSDYQTKDIIAPIPEDKTKAGKVYRGAGPVKKGTEVFLENVYDKNGDNIKGTFVSRDNTEAVIRIGENDYKIKMGEWGIVSDKAKNEDQKKKQLSVEDGDTVRYIKDGVEYTGIAKSISGKMMVNADLGYIPVDKIEVTEVIKKNAPQASGLGTIVPVFGVQK